jgi:hypothetical protein
MMMGQYRNFIDDDKVESDGRQSQVGINGRRHTSYVTRAKG